jgi:hypothetical protein
VLGTVDLPASIEGCILVVVTTIVAAFYPTSREA